MQLVSVMNALIQHPEILTNTAYFIFKSFIIFLK